MQVALAHEIPTFFVKCSEVGIQVLQDMVPVLMYLDRETLVLKLHRVSVPNRLSCYSVAFSNLWDDLDQVDA